MTLLFYLVKVHAVFTVLFLVYYFFLRNEKLLLTNRIILSAIVFSSLLLPLAPPVLKAMPWKKSSTQESLITHFTRPVYDIPDLPGSSIARQPFVNTEKIAELVLWLYAAVAVFLLTRFLLQLWRISLIIRRSSRSKLEEFTYCVQPAAGAPFSFFNFIVMPSGADDEKHAQILAHEHSHCRQWHSLDLLFTNITVIVLWLNPLAWLYQRQVRLNLEYLADEATLAGGVDAYSYQLNLLERSGQLFFNLPVTPYASMTGKRIHMMNKTGPGWSNSCKYGLLLPVLLLASAFSGSQPGEPGNKNITAIVQWKAEVPGTGDYSEKKKDLLKSKTLKKNVAYHKRNRLQQKEASPVTQQKIHVDATTSNVLFRLLDEPISTKEPFDGLYVIGDTIIPAATIRKALQSSEGTLNFMLSSRPSLTYYTAGSLQAINKWGKQAERGVVSLQTTGTGAAE